MHIRNSNKYAKQCGCTAVSAAIRPASHGSAKRNPSESEYRRRVYHSRYWGSPGGLYVIFRALRQLSSTAVNL